jgi:hypothetical protein
MCEQQTDYERGIFRLIEYVRQLSDTPSPTERRKAITAIADRLNAVLFDLETSGAAQGAIEDEHDQVPWPEVGFDGLPIPVPNWDVSYSATLGHMRALVDSAKRAADKLPNPRERNALPSAALGLLHLRIKHGFDRPRLSDTSPDVQELKRVCEAAGLFKSAETLRNALSKELQSFDPYYAPPWVDRIIDGG